MSTNQPELPAEVREAIEDILEQEYGRASSPVVTQSIFKVLAPLWPKQPHPSADVEKLAEEIAKATAHTTYDYAKGQAASILTRAFAEKDAEIARLNKALNGEEERAGIEISRRGEAERCAERAVAARDDFICRIAAVTPLVKGKDLADAISMLVSERDQLRAEVHGWRLIHSEPDKLVQELNQLRAELAAAQEDKERLDWLEGAKQQPPFVFQGYRQNDGSWVPGVWMNLRSGHPRLIDSAQPTLRAAIDAARKEVPHA